MSVVVELAPGAPPHGERLLADAVRGNFVENPLDQLKLRLTAGMTTARPSGATYRSIEVRRSQVGWSSDRPWSRYSTGAPAGPAAVPVRPIWDRVC